MATRDPPPITEQPKVTKQSRHLVDFTNLPIASVETTATTAQVLEEGHVFYYHYHPGFGSNKYGMCSLLKENAKVDAICWILQFDEVKVKNITNNNQKNYIFHSDFSDIDISEQKNYSSAIQSISEKIMQILLPRLLKKNWKSHSIHNDTPFTSLNAFIHHIISVSPNMSLIKLLTNTDIDWGYIDKEGNSFIHAACLLEKDLAELAVSIINKAINKKVNLINQYNSKNQTPLALCLGKKDYNSRILNYILEKGAALILSKDEHENIVISDQYVISCFLDEKTNTNELIVAYELVKASTRWFNSTYLYSQLNEPNNCRKIDTNKIEKESEALIRLLRDQFDVLLQTKCPQILDYVFDPNNKLISKLDKTKDGNSLLHIAVRNASSFILQHILTGVNNWDIVNTFSDNLIHTSIQLEKFSNLKELIKIIPKEDLNKLLFSPNFKNLTPWRMMMDDPRAHESLVIAMTKGCVDRNDNNFIHITVEREKIECLKYLVSNSPQNFVLSKNKDRITPLQLAIRKSSVDAVKFLLPFSCESLDSEDNFGCNCLHSSIIFYHNSIFETVLSAVCTFDASHHENKLIDRNTKYTKSQYSYPNSPTPFLLSIQLNKLDATELLVAHGADINKKDGGGRDMFYYILQYCEIIDSLRKVLTIKVDKRNLSHLNDRIEIQDLPNILAYFYRNGNLDSFTKCFETLSLTNRFRQNTELNTILHLAFNNRNNQVIEYLLTKLSELHNTESGDLAINFINTTNNQGETALSLAVRNSMHSFTQRILDLGADIQRIYTDRDTILHIAIDTKDTKMVSILLKHPNMNTLYTKKNDQNKVPIIELMKSGNSGSVSADINTVDGDSLLHYAVQIKDSSIQNQIFEQLSINSEIKVKNKDGRTAFHYAIMHQNKNAIEKLIEQKVDLSVSDITGKTAIHFAIDAKNTEIWKIIFQYLRSLKNTVSKEIIDKHSHNIVNPFQYSILRNFLPAVEGILALFPNLYTLDEHKNTIIHLASHSIEFASILKCLLNTISKEDLNTLLHSSNKEYLHPLHYAIKCNNTEAVKLLKLRGLEIAVPFKGKLSFLTPQFEDKLTLCKKVNPTKGKFIFGYRVKSTTETLYILTAIPNLTNTDIYSPSMVQEVRAIKEEDLSILLQVPSSDIINFSISKPLFNLERNFSGGSTLLHLAAQFGSCQILNYFFGYKGPNHLLIKHIDIFTLDSKNNSILHYALQNKNKDVFPLVCQNIISKRQMKINVFNLPNSDSKRPLDLCLEMDNLEGFKTLLSEKYDIELLYQHSNGTTLLHNIILNKNCDCDKFISQFIKTLELRHSDKNVISEYIERTNKDFSGYNAIHLATLKEKVSLLRLLAEYMKKNGINLIDSRIDETFHRTALHIASSKQNIDVAKILLENGAKPELTDSEGRNPLHYVALSTTNDEHCKEFILILLQKSKGLLAMKDNKGQTPVFHAVTQQKDAVLKEFLHYEINFLDGDKDGKSIIHYSIDSKQDLIWEIVFPNFKASITKVIRGNTTLDLFQLLQYCIMSTNFTAFTDLLSLDNTFIITDTHWVELIAASISTYSQLGFLEKVIVYLKAKFPNYIQRFFCPEFPDFVPPLQLAIQTPNISAIRVMLQENIPLAFPIKGNQMTLYSQNNPQNLVICNHNTKSELLIGYKIKSATRILFILVKMPDLTNTRLYKSEEMSELEKYTEDQVIRILKCQSTEPINAVLYKIKLNEKLIYLAAQFGSILVLKYILTYQGAPKLNALKKILFHAILNQNPDFFQTVCNFLFENKALEIFNTTNNEGKRIIDVCMERDDNLLFNLLLQAKYHVELDFVDAKEYTLFHKIVLLKKELIYLEQIHNTCSVRYKDKRLEDKPAGISKLTALHFAILENRPDLTKFMLQNKYDINARTKCGNTPLHLAVQCNSIEITKSVLETEGSGSLLINTQNKEGYTPLIIATQNANIDIIELLLAQSTIKVDIVDKSSRTVLHHALLVKEADVCTQILPIFLKSQNIILMTDKDGQTALYYSVIQKNIDALNIFLKINDISLFHKDKYKKTIFHYAIEINFVPIWKAIFEKLKQSRDSSYRIEEKFKDQTLLVYSIEYNSLTTFQDILSLNPDLNVTDSKGNTPLHIAAISPKTNGILNSLIYYLKRTQQKKIHDIVCSQNNDHLAPFHFAIENNNISAIDTFIKQNIPFVFYDKLSRELTICSKDSPLALSLCVHIQNNSLYTGYKVINQDKSKEIFWILTKIPDLNFEAFKYEHKNIQEIRKVSEIDIQTIVKCPSPEPILTFLKSKLIPENFQFTNNSSMLHIAARFGSIEVVSKLSETMKLVTLDQNNESILFYALQNANLLILNFLLTKISKCGKDDHIVNTENNSDKRIIEVAIDIDKFEFFEHLLKKEFNIELTYRDSKGLTLLHKVIQEKRDIKYLMALLNEIKARESHKSFSDYINSRNGSNETALHLCISHNQEEMLNTLLTFTPNYSCEDSGGNTPLHCAVSKNIFVDLLINSIKKLDGDKSSLINAVNKHKLSPLHLAIINSDICTAELLLSEKAILYAIDEREKSVLHYAIEIENETKCETTVKFLIEYEQNHPILLQMQDNEGFTPLHVAVKKKKTNILNILIKQRPNVTIKDKMGQTVLHHSVCDDIEDIVDLLMEYIDKTDEVSNIINLQDNEGNTPLHLAIMSENCYSLEKLLSHRPIMDVKNNSGLTPLHLAVSKRQEVFDKVWGVIEVEKQSSDINRYLDAMNNEGLPPLQYAIMSATNKEYLEKLIENGAKLSFKDDTGITLFAGKGGLNLCIVKQARYEIKRFQMLSTLTRNILGFNWFVGFKVQHTNYWALTKLPGMNEVKIVDGADVEEVTTSLDYKETILANIVQCECTDPLKMAIEKELVDDREKEGKGNKLLDFASKNKGSGPVLKFIHSSSLSLDEFCSCIENSNSNLESLNLIFTLIPEYNYDTINKDISECNELEIKRNKIAIALSNVLLSCLENESTEQFKFLLSHKLCLNRQYDDDNDSLLHMMIKKGKNKEFLSLLLDEVNGYELEKQKIDGERLIDAKNGNSETALTLCINNRQEQNLNVLLEHKPSLSVRDKSGNNVLHLVAKTGDEVIAAAIVKEISKVPEKYGYLFNAPNSDGCIPLHVAVENGNKNISEILLENKSNYYSQDSASRNILHHAILNQDQTVHCSMIEFILNYEKNTNSSPSRSIVEFADISGLLPISYAIIHYSLAAVKLLAPYAETLKHRDKNEQSVLHLSSAHINDDIFDEIIKHICIQEESKEGESWLDDRVICYQDKKGRTALQLSIEHNNIYALERLLDKKPCLNITDIRGNSLLHLAVNGEDDKLTLDIILNEIRNRFSVSESYFYCENNEGLPPLQYAVKKNNLFAVDRCLKEGFQLAFKHKNAQITFSQDKSNLKLSIMQDRGNKELYAGYQIQKKWVVTGLPKMNKTEFKEERDLEHLDNAHLIKRTFIDVIFRCHSFEPLKAIINLLKISDKIGTNSLVEFAGKHSTVEVITFFIDHFKIEVYQPCDASLLESAIKSNPDINTVKEILKKLPQIENFELPDKSMGNFSRDQLISLCLYNSLEYSIGINDTEAFEELLMFGVKLDSPYGRNSGTILHLMAKSNAKFVNCLLKWVTALKENNKVFVNDIPFIDATNNVGDTALLLFTRKQLQTHIEFILEYSPSLSNTDSKGNNVFHLATQSNNFTILKSLVAYAKKKNSQAILDEKNSDGLTPLFIAVNASNLEISEHLLCSGSSLFLTDKNKQNALHHVVMLKDTSKRTKFITLLLEKLQGDVPILTRTQDVEKRTPLHLAVINQYYDALDLLLKADPFALTLTDIDEKTALHLAAQRQSEKIVKLLTDSIQHEEVFSQTFDLLQERVICFQDNEQKTALHHCIEKRNNKSLTILLETKPCLDLTDKDGNTLLHYAVSYPLDEKMLDLLLKELTERFPKSMPEYLYAENSDGMPPLQHAILNKRSTCAEKLIEYKANLAYHSTPECLSLCHGKKNLEIEFLQKEAKGSTRKDKKYDYFAGLEIKNNCWVACSLPKLENTTTLIKQNIELTDGFSNEFLLSILTSCSVEPFIAALHSKYGYFSLDMKFKDGRFFKHIVAQYASRQVMSHFLTLFDEPVYQYGDGNKSMIEYAVLNKTDPSTLQLLLRKSSVSENTSINQKEIQTHIDFCVKKSFVASLENNDTLIAFENLLTFVTRIDFKFEQDDTLLHLVVKKAKTPEFIHTLFTKVINIGYPLIDGIPFIDVQNSNMKTALFTCIELERKEFLEILLTNSPDLAKLDTSKQNVLHLAVSKDLFEFTEILLLNINIKSPKKGNIVNSQNNVGLSPLHYAVKNGNTNMTKLLLESNADFFTTDNDNRTILHHAVAINNPSRREAMVEFILNHKNAPQTPMHSDSKASEISQDLSMMIRKVDTQGYTPLHLSVILQSLDAVKLLLKSDPQTLNLKDHKGHTPLHLSIIPRKDIMDESDTFCPLGPKLGSKPFDEIYGCIKDEHVNIASCNGTNVICYQDNRGRTAMHYAIQYRDVDVFKKLLETKSCLDIPDAEGNRLLHESVMDPENIDCLILLTKELENRDKTKAYLDCFKF